MEEFLKEKGERVMQIEAKIGDDKYEADVEAELKVDKNNLDEELSKQAAKLGYFATLAEMLRTKLARRKLATEVLDAMLYKELREKLESEVTGSRGPTEAQVHSELVLDKRYQQARGELIDIDAQFREFYAFVGALNQRGTMVAALAKMMALEFGSSGSSIRRDAGEAKMKTKGGEA